MDVNRWLLQNKEWEICSHNLVPFGETLVLSILFRRNRTS